MKVVVVFKWSRNPIDARVSSDGTVDWRGVKMAASDDDPAVMEIARALAEGDEIIGLTVGDGDTAWAAARGAARTVVVTDALSETNSSAMGAVLAAAIRRLPDVDAVIIGDSSWDYGVVSALTGQLGWPAVAGVVAATTEQGRLRVTRKMGNIAQDLEVKGPAVLAAVASRAEQNAPGMKEVLMARKKPVEQLTLADLDLTPAIAVNFRGTRFPDTPPARIIDGADPAAACQELMAGLSADGVV
ncbi:MAG: electron transfer flavoprotein subunit beta/FixA family protein [Desulfitobacteriia bacterium]|jgi:electron transfer flavoprotein beta subunit